MFQMLKDKKGSALVEYGLLIAGVALVCAAAVSVFGHKTNDIVAKITSSAEAITTAVNSGHDRIATVLDEKSARIEVRSVAPDSNPYLTVYTLLRTGLEGPQPDAAEVANKRTRTRFLPDNCNDAIRLFKSSRMVAELLGETIQTRFAEVKQASAERCPRALGSLIKAAEVQFHHEVTNQYLWNQF